MASARWLGRATDLAQAAKKLQDILGEHRDATLFAAHAEELAGSGLGSATRDALLRVAEDSRARAAEALEPLRRAAKRLAATAEAMR